MSGVSVLSRLSFIAVLAAGVYLLVLGIASMIAPEGTRRFLAGFASSRRAHLGEMSIRLLLGAAFISIAPAMKYSSVVGGFGWVLVATTVVLLALPWRWHHRFASWSVPRATRNMNLFAVGPILGGIALLYSLLG